MKIALVGGAGFIGSSLAKKLDDATIIDIARPGEGKYIYPIDASNEKSIAGVFSWLKPDIVYYMAAMIRSEDCRLDPVGASNVNVQGLVNTLQACVTHNVKRIVFSSTIHVYANVKEDTASEDTHVPFPDHIYPCSKMIGEQLIKSFHSLYELPYTILRYGVVCGPRGHSDMVAHSFVNKFINDETLVIEGDGTIKRNFVYIDDLVRGNILALGDKAENETFNICGDQSVTIREIVDIVGTLEDKPIKVEIGKERKGDFKGVTVINNKARDVLGWIPKVTLAEGIRNYYQWIKSLP
jgi:UDP-glucose 4-epimerase